MLRHTFFAAAVLCLGAIPASAQVGPLIFEESFTSLQNWIVEEGNGSWGWGNGELQYYHPANASIAPVPGEPGNQALRLRARQQSGAGIVDQWGGPLNYTSGRVSSKSRLAIQYGMIEVRARIPSLDTGGWPAIWLLGDTNLGWPRSGEIDMMEMGWTQAFRDLHDTHNGGNGLNNSTVDQVVGANAIFYTPAAINPQNPSGAASLAFDPNDQFCRPYYNHDNPLVNRFLLYRLYWDENSLRFTVVDDGVEHDLYAAPFPIGEESDEFRQPFYMIMNLAVGGTFTDAYNLGDEFSGLPVSMPFDADMYVDYIRVYEFNGQGSVRIGPPEQQPAPFGVFTDNTPVNAELVPEISSEIYVWEGTLEGGDIAPFEGNGSLSWQTTGRGWFGAGVFAIQPLNLSALSDGYLTFRMKMPANVSFRIGIFDAWTNVSWVDFPAFQTTFGLQRDGEWGQAVIPVSVLRGTSIDMRMLTYPFAILEENGTPANFAIDDIVYVATLDTDADSDGVADAQDNCSVIANADQRDSDGDNFGNACDADLNNDCAVNVVDLGLLRASFFTDDADADLNGDGVVNVIDLGLMRAAFFGAPGPSGLTSVCD